MSFRVNIDYPTKIGRIHLGTRELEQKKEKDGYWSDLLPTSNEAEELAKKEGAAPTYCKKCF